MLFPPGLQPARASERIVTQPLLVACRDRLRLRRSVIVSPWITAINGSRTFLDFKMPSFVNPDSSGFPCE